MKKVCFALIFLCLLVNGCRIYDCRLQSSALSGAESRILQNRFLRAEVVPVATGAVVGLEYLPLKKEIMTPFTYSIEKIDLIPDRVVIGGGGSRILLWGEQNLSSQAMQISQETVSADCCSVELFNPYYQSTDLRLRKTVSLKKGRAALHLNLQAENGSRSPRTITLWDNMIAELDAQSMDAVLMPALGQISKIGKRGVQYLPEDGIFVDDDEVFDKVIFVSPARNWIARRNPISKLIFAIRTDYADLHPDGFFYTWKKQSGSSLHTMELILNPVTLQPGETKNYHLEYLFFNGLPDLHEICGDIGIYAEIMHNQIRFLLNSVEPKPVKTLQICLLSKDHKKWNLGEKNLQFRHPDEVRKVIFSLPDLPSGVYRICGSFDGQENFELLKTLTIGE